jgi:hypothetical protein
VSDRCQIGDVEGNLARRSESSNVPETIAEQVARQKRQNAEARARPPVVYSNHFDDDERDTTTTSDEQLRQLEFGEQTQIQVERLELLVETLRKERNDSYDSAWAILCFNLAAPLVFICAIVLYALYERFTGAQLTDGVKLLLGGMVCAAGGMVYGARCFAGAIKTYPRS